MPKFWVNARVNASINARVDTRVNARVNVRVNARSNANTQSWGLIASTSNTTKMSQTIFRYFAIVWLWQARHISHKIFADASSGTI